jgi:DNA-binding NarL/FixJ family response regulator
MGLRALFAEAGDFEVVGECGQGAAARDLVMETKPDLVITELHLVDQNGLTLVRDLGQLTPAPRVLMLALHAPEVAVHQALAAGAGGYVVKWQSPREIVGAAREVLAGRSVLPAGWEGGPIDASGGSRRGRLARTVDRLSEREREIFDLVVWGQSNKQIAARLGISIKTVETHRGHINGKLRVHTSADMVRLAALLGLMNPGGAATGVAPLRDGGLRPVESSIRGLA